MNPTCCCFLKRRHPWPGARSCHPQFVFSVMTLFLILSLHCLDHKPPLQTSISAGGPSLANSFKLASLQKGHGNKNRQFVWKQELLDWWNFSDVYSLTSKPCTLHKILPHCRQILKPSYLVRLLLLPNHCAPCLCSNQHDQCSCYRPPSKLRRL